MRLFVAVFISGLPIHASLAEGGQPSVIHFADTPYAPYIQGDVDSGEVTGGTAVILIHAIFSRIDGVDAEFLLMPWQRTLRMLEQGDMDAVSLIAYTPEREEFLAYSLPFVTTHSVLFYRKEDYPEGLHWQSFHSLVDRRIGVVKGYLSDHTLHEFVDQGVPLTIKRLTGTPKQLFGMLVKNRVDFFSYNFESGIDLIRQNNWQAKIGFSRQTVFTELYHIGISRKSPFIALLPEINQVISSMLESGELDQILHPNGLLTPDSAL